MGSRLFWIFENRTKGPFAQSPLLSSQVAISQDGTDGLGHRHALILIDLDGLYVFGCGRVEQALEVGHYESANALPSFRNQKDFGEDARLGIHGTENIEPGRR